MKTNLLYLKNAYQKTVLANVLSLDSDTNQSSITLDQTIFYPMGGGQPSDVGEIQGKHGSLKITHVSYNHGLPLHLGKLSGTLKKGDNVTLTLDWEKRYQNMRDHSAGHIIHEAVVELLPELKPIDANHGIGHKHNIIYSGLIDQSLLPQIAQLANQIVLDDQTISTDFVSKKELDKRGIPIPTDLPTNKALRIIQIGDRLPIPDGGTQVASTSEVGPIKLIDVQYDNGHSILNYQIEKHVQTSTPISSKRSTVSNSSFKSKTQSISLTSIKNDLQILEKEYHQDQTKLKQTDLEKKYLSRNGLINQLTRRLSQCIPLDRPQAGQLINQFKTKINHITIDTSYQKNHQSHWIDVTIPGKLPPLGHLHPISQAIEEITRIFAGIGFTRVRYPEVDWDFYAFEGLNMPSGHPARDEWETFFVDALVHKKFGKMIMTPHTSNGQVREMERIGKPPIRMLNIAKCYRRQQDITHTSMFHQFEGLVIDRGINIQHLKGTLDYFARHFYGEAAKSRIRPFMFKFTEPSFEVDFSCIHCGGKGCRFCKSGWHEVGGSGMVHPNVLKAGGIDPTIYTGFAFGWGVERVYTLKPGLHLNDIRPFYQNNLEFLSQF